MVVKHFLQVTLMEVLLEDVDEVVVVEVGVMELSSLRS